MAITVRFADDKYTVRFGDFNITPPGDGAFIGGILQCNGILCCNEIIPCGV